MTSQKVNGTGHTVSTPSSSLHGQLGNQIILTMRIAYISSMLDKRPGMITHVQRNNIIFAKKGDPFQDMGILVTLAVFLVIELVSAKYNCKSEGVSGCNNAGNCTYFGRCECNAGYAGHDCGLPIAQKSSAQHCMAKCLNGGTCYNGRQCYCTEDYYGKLCEYKTESVKCGFEAMEIIIMTSTNFLGDISTKPNITGCQFQRAYFPNVTARNIYQLVVPLNLQPTNPCSKAITRNVTTETVRYEVGVAISERKGTYNPLKDRIASFECTYPRGTGKSLIVDKTTSYNPVELVYLDDNKQPLLKGVAEGEVFFIDFSPTIESGATGVQVVNLEAFSVANGQVIEFKMVENGCILPKAETRVKSMSVVDDTRMNGGKMETIYKTRVEMTAFALLGNSYLHFNYDLKFCQGQCKEIPCGTPAPIRLRGRYNHPFGRGLNIFI